MSKVIVRFSLVLGLFLIVLPLVSLVLWSFGITLPSGFTLRGISYFFTSGDYLWGVKSALFSATVALCAVILSIPVASYLCQNLKPAWKNTVENLMYLPMLLPVISICFGAKALFGSVDSLVQVFIIHLYLALPYAFRLVYAYYDALGVQEEEVAKTLGANGLQAFIYVGYPKYRRAFGLAFAMSFTVSYSQYFVNAFLGDSRTINFTMILSQLIAGGDRVVASAYTLFFLLISLVTLGLVYKITKKI